MKDTAKKTETSFAEEIDRWCDKVTTADLRQQIINFHETGACSAAPPVMGALVQLGIYNDDEKLKRAYEIVTS